MNWFVPVFAVAATVLLLVLDFLLIKPRPVGAKAKIVHYGVLVFLMGAMVIVVYFAGRIKS